MNRTRTRETVRSTLADALDGAVDFGGITRSFSSTASERLAGDPPTEVHR